MATARSLIAGLTLALTAVSCTDKGPTEANNTSDNQTPKAEFQNNSRQFGLVNVSVGNVDVLNNVNLAIAANVLATVCGDNIPIAVLATQVIGTTGTTRCNNTTNPVTITQAVPGANRPSGGGNNSQQAGLVNVSVGDVAILNNVNVGVAANVLVTVCGLKVPIAILSAQAIGSAGDTFCTNTANPVTITQAQG